MVGNTWIRFYDPWTKTDAAGPYEITVGYDIQRHQWVDIEIIGSGYYIIQRSTAAPDSSTQTYAETYPIYPGDGPETIAMTKNNLTFSYSVKKNGNVISVHDVCRKNG